MTTTRKTDTEVIAEVRGELQRILEDLLPIEKRALMLSHRLNRAGAADGLESTNIALTVILAVKANLRRAIHALARVVGENMSSVKN